MIPVVRLMMWLVLPVVVAGLVVIDPWLIRSAPADLTRVLQLRSVPYATPLFVGVMTAVAISALRVLRKAKDFAALSLMLIMMASQLNGFGMGPLDILDIALFGIFAFWIAQYALDVTRPIRLSMLFFLATGLVVMAIAHLPMMSPVPWFVGLFGISRVAVISLLVVDLCRDLGKIDAALRALVATAVVSAAIGVVQFTLAYTQIYTFTLIDPPLSAFKPTPIGFVMRASGLCITAQHFSSFLVYALPFALWRLSENRSWRNAAGIGIILAGIAVSLNFGAIFAAMLVIGLMPFLRWPQYVIHLGLALLGLASVTYFLGGLDLIYDLSFGDSGISKGVDQRKTLFTLGLEQFGRNPLIGTGMNGFGDVDGNFWHRPVHNMFGQAAVELGIGGLLIFLTIFFILTLDLARCATQGGPTAKYTRTGFLMLAAALLLGQSEPNLDQSNLWIVLALAQSMILTLRAGDVKAMRPQSP